MNVSGKKSNYNGYVRNILRGKLDYSENDYMGNYLIL